MIENIAPGLDIDLVQVTCTSTDRVTYDGATSSTDRVVIQIGLDHWCARFIDCASHDAAVTLADTIGARARVAQGGGV